MIFEKVDESNVELAIQVQNGLKKEQFYIQFSLQSALSPFLILKQLPIKQ